MCAFETWACTKAYEKILAFANTLHVIEGSYKIQWSQNKQGTQHKNAAIMKFILQQVILGKLHNVCRTNE